MKRIYQLIVLLFVGLPAMAQVTRPQATPSLKVQGTDLDYFQPKEYIIGGTTLTGASFIDKEVIITLSKLIKGETILLPSEATSTAIKTLWSPLQNSIQTLADRISTFCACATKKIKIENNKLITLYMLPV